jgi:hypothetical protein
MRSAAEKNTINTFMHRYKSEGKQVGQVLLEPVVQPNVLASFTTLTVRLNEGASRPELSSLPSPDGNDT